MVYEIVFSATGRTKKVADIVSSVWNEDKVFVDLSATDFQPIELSENDLAIVAVPSYGGKVPKPAAERLRFIKGNNATALLIAVFGNRATDDTLIELQEILLFAQDFRTSGAIEAVAEHSIMPQFGVGRPDDKDRAELISFAQQFKERLENGTLSEQITVPYNMKSVKSANMPIHPKANKTCTKCGSCVEGCPVSAIPKDNPNLTDKSKCITCMRCVSICPQHARALPSAMVSMVAKLMKGKFAGRKENKLYL